MRPLQTSKNACVKSQYTVALEWFRCQSKIKKIDKIAITPFGLPTPIDKFDIPGVPNRFPRRKFFMSEGLFKRQNVLE